MNSVTSTDVQHGCVNDNTSPSLATIPNELLGMIMEDLQDGRSLHSLAVSHRRPYAVYQNCPSRYHRAISLNLFGDNLFFALNIINFEPQFYDYEFHDNDEEIHTLEAHFTEDPPPIANEEIDADQMRELDCLATGITKFLEYIDRKAAAASRRLSPIERARITRALLRFELMALIIRTVPTAIEDVSFLIEAMPGRHVVEEVRCVYTALMMYLCEHLEAILIRRDKELAARILGRRATVAASEVAALASEVTVPGPGRCIERHSKISNLQWMGGNSFRSCHTCNSSKTTGFRSMSADVLTGITDSANVDIIAQYITDLAPEMAFQCEMLTMPLDGRKDEVWISTVTDYRLNFKKRRVEYASILHQFHTSLQEEIRDRSKEPPQPFEGDDLREPNKAWVRWTKTLEGISHGFPIVFWAKRIPWQLAFWVFLDEERMDREGRPPLTEDFEAINGKNFFPNAFGVEGGSEALRKSHACIEMSGLKRTFDEMGILPEGLFDHTWP